MARANSCEHVIGFVLSHPHRIKGECLSLNKTLNSYTFIYDDAQNSMYKERAVKSKYLNGLDLDEWIAEGVAFTADIGVEIAAQNASRKSDVAKAVRESLTATVSFDLGDRIAKLFHRVEVANFMLDRAPDPNVIAWTNSRREACEALFAIGIPVVGYFYEKPLAIPESAV